MFEDDDNFDLSEEDFLKAAENVEDAAPSNIPSKRRSFELGGETCPGAKRAKVQESESSQSPQSPVISFVGEQNIQEPIQDIKLYTLNEPLGLDKKYGLKSDSKKEQLEGKGFYNYDFDRVVFNTDNPITGDAIAPRRKSLFQLKSPQHPTQTKDKISDSPQFTSENMSKESQDTNSRSEAVSVKPSNGTCAAGSSILSEALPSSPKKLALTSNIFSQSTLDSELDLSLDLSPWKLGKTVVQKAPVPTTPDDILNVKTRHKSLTPEKVQNVSPSLLKIIPPSIQNIMSNPSNSTPLSKPNWNSGKLLDKDKTLDNRDERTCQPDTLSLPLTLDTSLSFEAAQKTTPSPRDFRPLSPTPPPDFNRTSRVNKSLSESRQLSGQSKTSVIRPDLVRICEDPPKPVDHPVLKDVPGGRIPTPTSHTVRRAHDDNTRSRDGTLRSEDSTLRSGDGTMRSGGSTLRSGDGTLRSGDGTLRSGDGTLRSGGGTLRSRDDSAKLRDKPLGCGAQLELNENNIRSKGSGSRTPESPPVRPVPGFLSQPADSGSSENHTTMPIVGGAASNRGGGSKRKRKFPGPAGVLPKLKHGLDSVRTLKPQSPAAVVVAAAVPAMDDTVLVSQSSEERGFRDNDVWETMTRELEPNVAGVLRQFSISAVLAKAAKRQLPRGKVPVLACILDQLQLHSNTQDASVTLKDPSGEMRGTLHRQLLKEYPGALVSGSVLLLRQVAVFSPTTRNHYLNITPNNIVRIYSRDLDESVAQLNVSRFITDDFKLPDPSQFVAPSPRPPPPQSPRLNQGLFQNRYGSPDLQAPSIGQFKAPAMRPRTNAPGNRPRFANSPNVGASPRFGNSPNVGASPRFGNSPNVGASPRFGNSPNVGASPRFGNSPNTGASPRFGNSPNVGASPRFGNSPRLPSNSPGFNTSSNIQNSHSPSTPSTPHSAAKSKPPPPWLKKSAQVDSNTRTLDQGSVERTVVSGDKTSVTAKPPWLQTAQHNQCDLNSRPVHQSAKDNSTASVSNTGATVNSTSSQSTQSTSSFSSTKVHNSKNTTNTETHDTAPKSPVSSQSRFTFKRPAFKPPPKVNDSAVRASKDHGEKSAAKPSDVSDLLEGVVDDLLDDF